MDGPDIILFDGEDVKISYGWMLPFFMDEDGANIIIFDGAEGIIFTVEGVTIYDGLDVIIFDGKDVTAP